MRLRGSPGTTLPEIMVALVIAGIISIGYSSLLMFTRNMYNDTVVRSQLSQDVYIVNQYVRSKLNLQLGDSLKIYADAVAEEAGTSSSSGTILRSVRIDSTVDHLTVESSRLVWEIDSLAHYPIDSDISSLLFSTRSGYSKTILDVSMTFFEGTDTLSLEWIVSIRN